jgi:CheY-like chemotaxis protein
MAIALQQAGCRVTALTNSLDAVNALDAAPSPDLLITRIQFPDGQPHGIALARMAWVKWGDIKVIITGRPEFADHAEGVGTFLPNPVDVTQLVEIATQLLSDSVVDLPQPS